MKNVFKFIPYLVVFTVGISMVKFSGCPLDELRNDVNPFSIKKSGYGMIFARLSQQSVDRDWHLGVENSAGKSSDGDKAAEAIASSSDNGCQLACRGFCNRKLQLVNCSDSCEELTMLEEQLRRISDLKFEVSNRTSRYGISERHKLSTKNNIRRRLAQSFALDPTNYGVYNSYFLFLTSIDIGGDYLQAEKVSRIALESAFDSGLTTPEANLTGAAACLNVFLLRQQLLRDNGEEIEARVLINTRDTILKCLARYEGQKHQEIVSGGWSQLSAERVAEIEERARYAKKTCEQFDVMLSRISLASSKQQ